MIGDLRVKLGPVTMAPITMAVTTIACQSINPRFSITAMRCRYCCGKFPISNPRTLSSCPDAITNAIPDVNPTITGLGMNWIRRPIRKSPSPMMISPAIAPASHMPGSP